MIRLIINTKPPPTIPIRSPPTQHWYRRRQVSCLSPRTVLVHTSKSYFASIIAFTAIILYLSPDLQKSSAKELSRAIDEAEWANDLKRHRSFIYACVNNIGSEYLELSKPVTVSKVQPPYSQLHVSILGTKATLDLGDFDTLLTRLRIAMIDPILAFIPIDQSAFPFPLLQQYLHTLNNHFLNHHYHHTADFDIPLSQPDMGTRILAWLIDSVCVGLVASPVWRTPFFGSVVSLVWVSKDYLFSLLPGLNASPGYQVLGLNKIHVSTANQARNLHFTPSNLLASELPGMLGHNTLRLLTWCSSAGIVSNFASAIFCVYAYANGFGPAMAAWDRLAGVQVVYRSDLIDLEHRLIPKPKFPSIWSLIINHKSIQGAVINNTNNSLTDVSVHVVDGGGVDLPPAKMVFTYNRQSTSSNPDLASNNVPFNQITRKEFELPSWVVIK